MLKFFIQGLIIGFVISAPAGPVGLLCAQRTLKYGFWTGLISGFGAVTADTIYGLIAAFSISAILTFLISFQYWIRVVGGLCLIYFGLKLWNSKTVKNNTKVDSLHSLWGAYGSTVLLTLTSPITFLAFMAIFSVLDLGGEKIKYLHALALVLGIFISSTLWWLALTSFVAFFFKHHINPIWMKWINRISGGILLAFSAYALKVLF